MKIACESCGLENELGRVFCVNCGQRLNLSRTSAEEIRGNVQADRARSYGKAWVALIFLVVVGVAALVLWPASRVGESPATGGADKVRTKLWGLDQAVTVGESGGTFFHEGDINDYLATRAADLGFASLSVRLTQGHFLLRGVRPAVPVGLGKTSLGTIRISYEVEGSPSGADWNVTGGAIGHLPLFGPLKRFAFNPMADALAKAKKERQFLSKVSTIQVQPGRVEIKAQR